MKWASYISNGMVWVPGCVLVPLLVAGVVALFIILVRAFLIVVTVQGESMTPTLQNGDRVLALSKWPRGWLHSGRIVIIATVPEPATGQPTSCIIKRVTGVEGDTIFAFTEDVPESVQLKLINKRYENDLLIYNIPPGYLVVSGDMSQNPLGPFPFEAVLGVYFWKLGPTTQ